MRVKDGARQRKARRLRRRMQALYQAPRRPKVPPICRSCGAKFATPAECRSHRTRTHGPYTYKGYALALRQDNHWEVFTPQSSLVFASKLLARDYIDRKLGVRGGTVHTVSGGLPTLGKRR
jgi:hypothetical protein